MRENQASRTFSFIYVLQIFSLYGNDFPYFEAVFKPIAHGSAHEFRSDEVHTECVYHTLKASQKYRNFDDFAEIGFERGAFCACAYVHTKNGSFPALCIITKSTIPTTES